MITIATVATSGDLAEVRELFEEYAASLDVDLAYQDFGREVSSLPGGYAPPKGALFVARDGSRAVGCVGVRPFGPGSCEIKRLYVRAEARRTGLGRELAGSAIAFAQSAGYRAMRLDTHPSMRAAQAMYRALGFQEIAPYRVSPVAGTVYMELELRPGPG